MQRDSFAITDRVTSFLRKGRQLRSGLPIFGHGVAVLRGPDGEMKAHRHFTNLVTQVGDQFYGEKAHGLGTLDPVSGMKLGTGTTAPAKTGAGATIVTYVTGSHVALDSTPSSSLNGSARRITFAATWAAGVATDPALAEVALSIQTPLADDAGAAANHIARALLSPTINKEAGDSLVVTWHHDLEAS